MSQAWVIDSSVGFAWVHPSQATPESDALLDQIEAGAMAVVPALWFAEVANGLLILQRRHKLTAGERKAALETLLQLSPIVDEESGQVVFGKTSELAEKFDLTVYDAMYLEVALRRKLPLASRDSALVKAARKAGVKVLPTTE